MFEQLTVPADTVKQLNIQIPGHSFAKCMLSVENCAVRMRLDNQDPTSDVGLKIQAGSVFALTSRREIVGARFLGIGGTAIVNVAYLG